MTSINRLTQISEAADNDIIPLWDASSGRTRGILASNLKQYLASDEIVSAKIVNDHLILIKEDGSEIDAGELPSHSGINVSDSGTDKGQFSRLDLGDGLDVEADGLTAKIKVNETVGSISILENGEDKGRADKLDVGVGLNVSVADKVAKITSSDSEVIQLQNFEYGDALDPKWQEFDHTIWTMPGRFKEFSNWFFNEYDYGLEPETYFELFGEVRNTTLFGHDYIEMFAYYITGPIAEGFYKAGRVDNDDYKNCKWKPITGIVGSNPPRNGVDKLKSMGLVRAGAGVHFGFENEQMTISTMSANGNYEYFDNDKAIADPDGIKTLVYSTPELNANHTLTISIDPTDVSDTWSQVVTNAHDSHSVLKINAGGVIYHLSPGNSSCFFISGGAIAHQHIDGATVNVLSTNYNNALIIEYKKLTTGSYITTTGTLDNWSQEVNGKEGHIFFTVVNKTNDGTAAGNQVMMHKYLILCSDGTKLSMERISADVDSFPQTPTTTDKPIDPGEGFFLKKNRVIVIEDGAELRQMQGSDITASFDSGVHNVTQIKSNTLVLGTSQGNVGLELRSGVSSIPVQVGPYARHLAFQENCVEDIQAGDGIDVNANDTNKPIVSVKNRVKSVKEGTGIKVNSDDAENPTVSIDPTVVKDPSDGFELKADKTIEVLSSAEIVLHRGSFLSGKFSNDKVHRIIDFGDFGDTHDQVRVGNHQDNLGLQIETSKRFIYAVVKDRSSQQPGRYTVALNAMVLSPFTKGASIYELEDGTNYVGLDRQTPVVVTEAIDNLCLVKITDPEIVEDDEDGVPTVTQLPKVRKGNYGDLASGFSLCPDGADADSEIIQIASGTYSLEQMTFAAQAEVEDLVYVGEDGKLTLAPSEHIAGWVINNGVVIDIDLYNASLNDKKSDSFDTLVTRVLKVHEGPESPDKFTQVYIDGNKNTTIHAIGDTHFYRKDPESDDLTEIFQVDNANRLIVKTKIKVPVITNTSNGTTNSSSNGAAYFDLSTSNTTKIGAYSEIKMLVGGTTVISCKNDSATIDTDLLLTEGKKISFSDIGDGEIRNLGIISRNDENDRNSVTLGDGENIYKSNQHTFRINDGTEVINFTSEGVNAKNNNIKHIRHLVGNTPTSMFVANISKIKRDDAENDKDVIDFATDSITAKSKKIEFKDDTNSRRLTIESHKADWHGCQLNNLADGKEDSDAATVGQLNAVGGGGIPYLRKFDSNGGQIFAHSYPEGRVQAWINFKGNGATDVSIDSMRPIPEGQTGQMYDMIALDNQSQNVCKLRLFYENSGTTVLRIMPGEVVQCWTSREFKRWKWQYGTESSISGSTSLAIEENNDEIITPNKGEQFQLIDSDKASSYGNANKQVTYFAPNAGTQSELLLSHLDYGKAFAIHEEVNTTKLIMILHESLVAQIYDKDLTDVNELTMLFTGDSRGRLSNPNQTAAAQFAINWNGELIPADDDPNAINPTHWVASDDSVTQTWSNSVKSVCYSSGVLANRGSAMLKRGDVIYTKPDSVTHDNEALTETPKHMSKSLSDSGETATIVYDDNSKFFVMPIVAGGGTFNVMKVFQLFMSRKSQHIDDWGSLKFEQSSDCIGTILKIAYDAAIESAQSQDSIQTELFKMAADTVAEFPDSNFVIKTED